MNSQLYLVLDQGGHSSRALVFDAVGQVVAQSSVEVDTYEPQPTWVEQDPLPLVASLKTASTRALEQLNQNEKASLVSAALIAQRSSLACWDRLTGEALYPVISWQDRRAAKWLDGQSLDEQEVNRRTGLRPNPHYGASKIRWCLDHLEPVKQAERENRLMCGPLAGYLINQLSGKTLNLIDPANASRTLLWHIENQDWDEQLLQWFGVPAAVLPKLVTTEFDFGCLEFGELKVPLRLVNGDQSAAVFTSGSIDESAGYINIGTGAFISVACDQNEFCPEGLLKSLMHQNEAGHFVFEGTVNGAASALDWAQGKLGLDSFDNMEHWIETRQELPLFINGISGLGSPYWRELHSEFVGEGDKEQKMVAVLESILFLLQVNLNKINQHTKRVRHLRLSGGLSRIDGLCQKLADLSGMPVLRSEQQEASAKGAAFWLAGCPENWQEPDSQIFLPSLDGTEMINQRFQCWQREMDVRLQGA